jgi:hypothetical protein
MECFIDFCESKNVRSSLPSTEVYFGPGGMYICTVKICGRHVGDVCLVNPIAVHEDRTTLMPVHLPMFNLVLDMRVFTLEELVVRMRTTARGEFRDDGMPYWGLDVNYRAATVAVWRLFFVEVAKLLRLCTEQPSKLWLDDKIKFANASALLSRLESCVAEGWQWGQWPQYHALASEDAAECPVEEELESGSMDMSPSALSAPTESVLTELSFVTLATESIDSVAAEVAKAKAKEDDAGRGMLHTCVEQAVAFVHASEELGSHPVRGRLATLQKEVEAARSNVEAVCQRNLHLEQETKRLTEGLNKKEKDLKELHTVKAAKEKAAKALEGEKQRLSKLVEDEKRKGNTLQSRVTALQKSVEDLNTKLSVAVRDAEKAQSTANALKKSSEAWTIEQGKMDGERKKMKDLKEGKGKLEREIKLLKEKLETLESLERERVAVAAAEKRLREESELEASKRRKKSVVAAFVAVQREVQDVMNRARNLHSQLASLADAMDTHGGDKWDFFHQALMDKCRQMREQVQDVHRKGKVLHGSCPHTGDSPQPSTVLPIQDPCNDNGEGGPDALENVHHTFLDIVDHISHMRRVCDKFCRTECTVMAVAKLMPTTERRVPVLSDVVQWCRMQKMCAERMKDQEKLARCTAALTMAEGLLNMVQAKSLSAVDMDPVKAGSDVVFVRCMDAGAGMGVGTAGMCSVCTHEMESVSSELLNKWDLASVFYAQEVVREYCLKGLMGCVASTAVEAIRRLAAEDGQQLSGALEKLKAATDSSTLSPLLEEMSCDPLGEDHSLREAGHVGHVATLRALETSDCDMSKLPGIGEVRKVMCSTSRPAAPASLSLSPASTSTSTSSPALTSTSASTSTSTSAPASTSTSRGSGASGASGASSASRGSASSASHCVPSGPDIGIHQRGVAMAALAATTAQVPGRAFPATEEISLLEHLSGSRRSLLGDGEGCASLSSPSLDTTTAFDAMGHTIFGRGFPSIRDPSIMAAAPMLGCSSNLNASSDRKLGSSGLFHQPLGFQSTK